MVLEAKGIEKSFGSSKILKGIDISLEKGDVVAVLGRSGSGVSISWKRPTKAHYFLTASPMISPPLPAGRSGTSGSRPALCSRTIISFPI